MAGQVRIDAQFETMIRDLVESGRFASPADVVNAALAHFEAIEVEQEDWLRREGVARIDAWRGGDRRASPAADVFARLRARRS